MICHRMYRTTIMYLFVPITLLFLNILLHYEYLHKYKNYIFILNTFVGILIIFSKYAIMIGISLVKRKFRIFHYVSWLYGDQDSMDEVVYYDKSYREINGVVHCFSKSNNE